MTIEVIEVLTRGPRGPAGESTFVRMTDVGAGTANAIQVTSSIPTSESVLRVANVFEANTGNVTIAENGAAAKSLLTNSGNQIAPGGLTAGMMITYIDNGASYRLLSDQASAAIQAAAEAAADRAEDALADLVSGSGNSVVLSSAQTLTRTQKATVRDNIGMNDAHATIFSKVVDGAPAPPARILLVGHSHAAGWGTGNAALGIAEKLSQRLTAMGLPCERNGFTGEYNLTVPQLQAFDTRIVVGSGWVQESGQNCLGGHLLSQASGGTGYLEFTPGFEISSIRVHRPFAPGISTSLGVYANNALIGTINQVSGTSGVAFTDLSVPAGTTKIGFKNNGAATAYVQGVECFRGAQVATIVAAGHISFLTSQWVSGGFAATVGFPSWRPDLSVFYMATNDIASNIASATFIANLDAMLLQAAAFGNIILVIDPPSNNTYFTSGLYATYAAAMYGVAQKYGAKVVDLREVFSHSFTFANSKALTSDDYHPSALGYSLASNLLADQVMALL